MPVISLDREYTRPGGAGNVAASLAGLGTFWVGEGAGLAWPGGDLAIVPLGAAYLLLSVVAAALLRRRGAAV